MDNQACAIMFADIAGSTSLYDTLGDTEADRLIAKCIKQMSAITEKNSGRVIKTIGDEIMSQFTTADLAVQAAMDIQNAMEKGNNTGTRLSIRIGLGFGPVILRDNDLYGDAVNVAARMAGVAKARQIITTEELVNSLSEKYSSSARLFDRATVKGKEIELLIYQIVWEEQGVTALASSHDANALSQGTRSIALKYHGNEYLFSETDSIGQLDLGRDAHCKIVVDSDFASRSHVVITFKRGKLVLADHSTNGTFVSMQGSDNLFIRREELPLLGDGKFCLGEKVRDDGEHVVVFNILM